MKKLHPGVRWFFRLRVYSMFFPILIFIIFFSISVASNLQKGSNVPGIINFFGSIFIFLPIPILLVIIIAEIYARMSYNRFLYDLSEDSIKIERGIIWKKYSNIPYERVQNVDITRGIIARILGFSSVNVQTAGYSGPGQIQFRRGAGFNNMNSEGYLPGVATDEAFLIRDYLMKKITRK